MLEAIVGGLFGLVAALIGVYAPEIRAAVAAWQERRANPPPLGPLSKASGVEQVVVAAATAGEDDFDLEYLRRNLRMLLERYLATLAVVLVLSFVCRWLVRLIPFGEVRDMAEVALAVCVPLAAAASLMKFVFRKLTLKPGRSRIGAWATLLPVLFLSTFAVFMIGF